MFKPELTVSEAIKQQALRVIPNFSFSKNFVRDGGNLGSCFVSTRLMLLCAYIIMYGEERLLNYYSKAKMFPRIKGRIFNADFNLVAAAKTYIEECLHPNPQSTTLLESIYYEVATILYGGDSTICDESGEESETFFKIIQYDTTRGKVDYDLIISSVEKKPKAFIIVVLGHYSGDMFVGAHEVLLVNVGGMWILYDDVDYYNNGVVSGRVVRIEE